MSHNPLLRALVAELYIVAVVLVMYYAPKFVEPVETMLAPIAFLSLFVLSAAVMGYIFCYEPIRLYLEGEKDKAARLFLTTVGFFAGVTVIVFSLLFLISLRALV